MAKKSITEKFQNFLEASTAAESNEPMTGSEIATTNAKKKAKSGVAKPPAKTSAKNASKMAKKALPKKSAKNSKTANKKPKR